MDPAARPLEGLTVLVVEDSWHVADALRVTLELAGCKVVGPVGTLAQARRAAADGGFAAAVLDLDLHGERSDELALRLADSGTKVVVLSGFGRDVLAGRVHACLAKPAPTQTLIAELRRPLAT